MQYSLTKTILNVSEMCGMYMYKCVSVLRYFFLNILDTHCRYHKNVFKIMTVHFQKMPNIKITTKILDDALKLGKVSITH